MSENSRANTTSYQHPQETNLLNLHKAMQYNTDGQPEVRVTNSVTLTSAPWYLQVARGLVTGCTYESRSAFNPNCSANAATSIWVEGGIYPYATWDGTAQKLYIISTSASDTGQTIAINGLDSNYNHIDETIVTNGTTAVTTTKNFLRIHTAVITSSNTPNVGEITFRLASGVGTVVAHIGAGLSVTKLSQYTVPAGYTAYITYGDCTTFRTGSGNIGARLNMMVRPYGGTFFSAFTAEVVNGYYRNDFTIPMMLPEKTDVDVQIIADGNNTQTTTNYQILLIQNGI